MKEDTSATLLLPSVRQGSLLMRCFLSLTCLGWWSNPRPPALEANVYYWAIESVAVLPVRGHEACDRRLRLCTMYHRNLFFVTKKNQIYLMWKFKKKSFNKVSRTLLFPTTNFKNTSTVFNILLYWLLWIQISISTSAVAMWRHEHVGTPALYRGHVGTGSSICTTTGSRFVFAHRQVRFRCYKHFLNTNIYVVHTMQNTMFWLLFCIQNIKCELPIGYGGLYHVDLVAISQHMQKSHIWQWYITLISSGPWNTSIYYRYRSEVIRLRHMLSLNLST